jgi:cobalt-zinc-cadmium efflux system membrane fusion protein
LFEKDAEKVSQGQVIRFTVNNETEEHKAVIYQTGKSINTDRSYKVYATVTGSCKNVLPGMYVNALIEASNDKVTAVPSDAVVSFDDKSFIFLFDNNKEENGRQFTEYRMIQIQKGVSDGGYTQIMLPDGIDFKSVKVVIKGAYNLLSAKKNAGEMAC